jgi:hypothetical protein
MKVLWVSATPLEHRDTVTVMPLTQVGAYMSTLIEQQPALIVVDADMPAWDKWTSIPKSSPATRRIPILLLSEDAEVRQRAAKQGADIAMSATEFRANPPRWIKEYAIERAADTLAQMDCDCQLPLPPAAQAALRQFNDGQYYEQHDSFEALWVATESPVRDLYRAILQVGVAYYQIERGNYRGALKMLQRSVQWLVILPPVCQGVNVQKLRDDSFAVRAELERLGEAHFDQFDKALIRPVEWEAMP